ncbi:MAG: histidine kinase N-terminal 7TM domain-containing protein [Polyangiaceae bacterium]
MAPLAFTAPLVLACALLLTTALMTLARGKLWADLGVRGRIVTALLLLSGAIWSGAYLVELQASTLPVMLLAKRVRHVGMLAFPGFWLALTLWRAGPDTWVKQRGLGYFLVPTILFELLAWLKPGLFWTSEQLVDIGPFQQVDHERGPALIAFIAYWYALTALNLSIFFRAEGIKQPGVGALTAAGVAPLVANTLEALGLAPIPHLNLEPYGLLVTALVAARTNGFLHFEQLRDVARGLALQHMQDAVVLISGPGRVLDANHAARELLGTGALQSPEALAGVSRDFVDALNGDQDNFELLLDGSTFEVRVQRLDRSSGMPGARLIVLRDVTTKRKLDQQLVEAERLASVGILTAGVAHEINNPLTYVYANLSSLREGGVDQADAPQLLDEALDGAERIRRIVRDLRTFSAQEEEQIEAVELIPALEAAIKLSWHEIRHRAQLERDFGEVPAVRGNARRLTQVFVNLLVNAAQAIEDGHASSNEIRVRVRRDGRQVTVEISDTGVGIPEAMAAQVFEPFFTTKRGREGTGLGLHVCKSIVQAFGGEIELVRKDHGTLARVRLRVEGASSTRVRVSLVPSQSAERLRILLVDDDPLVGRAVGRMLREHHIVVASGGSQALELSETTPFDVLLCDVMMPEMTGPDLRAALERRGSALAQRTVFMTGGTFTEHSREALEASGAPVLDKPISPERLRQVIARVAKLAQIRSAPHAG